MDRQTAAVEDHAKDRTGAAEDRTGQDSSGIQVDIGRIGIKIK